MNKEITFKILEDLISNMKEGVHIVDKDGITLFYSEEMSKMEQQEPGDVIGKPFREVFSNIPLEDSTLSKALNNMPTEETFQTYLNSKGEEISSLNTTKPLIYKGEVIGAMEIAEDITRIKRMNDALQRVAVQDSSELSKKNIKERKKKVSRKIINQYTFDDLIGSNADFKKQINIAQKAANNNGAVFIYGETGTGKELFAQSIHFDGERGDKPFLAQNCAALPAALLEGILFGTSKGGFTGAEDRAGLFEQADGGTLLLDELSAMPYGLQSKILRTLQEGYIRRVGGSNDIPIDTRIIATVNKDPKDLIDEGLLRKDLYYRLKVIGISIPPLRDRKDDIPLLAAALLEKHCRSMGSKMKGFTQEAIDKLCDYDYPGNIRELENIIFSALFMAEGDEVIEEDDIVLDDLDEYAQGREDFSLGEETIDQYLFRVEKAIILRALKKDQGNISNAARRLGIKRQTLQHKLKKFNIKKKYIN